MDNTTLIALLTLIVIAVGGLLSVLWGRVSSVERQLADERVKSAERYITATEMERRLEVAIAPLERAMERLEHQNGQMLEMIRQHYAEGA